MKFACEKGHITNLELPDNAFKDGPLIISCVDNSCGLKYEVEKKGGKYKVKLYKEPTDYLKRIFDNLKRLYP